MQNTYKTLVTHYSERLWWAVQIRLRDAGFSVYRKRLFSKKRNSEITWLWHAICFVRLYRMAMRSNRVDIGYILHDMGSRGFPFVEPKATKRGVKQIAPPLSWLSDVQNLQKSSIRKPEPRSLKHWQKLLQERANPFTQRFRVKWEVLTTVQCAEKPFWLNRHKPTIDTHRLRQW